MYNDNSMGRSLFRHTRHCYVWDADNKHHSSRLSLGPALPSKDWAFTPKPSLTSTTGTFFFFFIFSFVFVILAVPGVQLWGWNHTQPETHAAHVGINKWSWNWCISPLVVLVVVFYLAFKSRAPSVWCCLKDPVWNSFARSHEQKTTSSPGLLCLDLVSGDVWVFRVRWAYQPCPHWLGGFPRFMIDLV